MAIIDAAALNDKALQDYDNMMVEATSLVENFAPLAFQIWSDVLRELGRRNMVTLVSGSYDAIGGALIRRNY